MPCASRIATIAIALLGGAPSAARAQLPGCPFKEGEIADWRWSSSWLGAQVTPKQITVLAKGDLRDGDVKVWGRPGKWSFKMEVIRPFTNISLIASNKLATLKWNAVARLEPPLPFKPQHWWWLTNITPVFDSKAGLLHGRGEMTLEILERDRVVVKIAISTKGLGEAIAKAEAAAKPIVDLHKSKRCVPGASTDDDL